MSAGRQNIIKQFCDVTGTDEERSKFFLESSNWQLDIALSSFYENGGNLDEQANFPTGEGNVNTDSRPTVIQSSSDSDSTPPSPVKKKDKSKRPQRTGFATLSSLQQDVSSSDEEEGQAFYAGGSERSGQQILDPTKRRDIVSEVFKSVRERGAVALEDEPSSAGPRQAGAFSGVGYRLGQTPDDHVPVVQPFSQAQEMQSVRLRLYREGYTVDDGPVRSYSDPQHAAFLTSIRRGEIPAELYVDGVEVRVALEDHRNEEGPRHSMSCKAAFSGKGHMLGSPTPPTVGAGNLEPVVSDSAANIVAAQEAMAVNEDLPATTLQIRLADGTRLTARFNYTHTVGDVRRYITTAMPSSAFQSFVLMTTFPSTELSDSKQTLEEAKLLNSVVVQRIK